MKFIQHPISESRGAQGIPSIPTLTIVSSPEVAPPAPPPTPVVPVPVASPAPLREALPSAAVLPSVPAPMPIAKTSREWQKTMEQQSLILEMDLKKSQVILGKNLKEQLHVIIQSQQVMQESQKIQFEKTVENVKQEWQEELNALEKNFKTQKDKWSGELEAKQSKIGDLQKEIEETRKELELLINEKKEKSAPVPAPIESVPMSAAPSEVFLSPVAESAPNPVAEPSPWQPMEMDIPETPRRSFLKSIWNYLSQPAIEIPLPSRRFDEKGDR